VLREFARQADPDWPVVQPAAPTRISFRRLKPKSTDVKTTVLVPDPQIGWWEFADRSLAPMHDEKAMATVVEIIGAVRPDVIINLGDFLDLAIFSLKFARTEEFARTTQASLDTGHEFLARQRAAAGRLAEIHLLSGNHDRRIEDYVVRNALAALRLRRADAPDGWPVLSIQNLLGLDSLDVNYVSGYPAARLKIADAHGHQTPLYAIHGEKTDMAKVARCERQSYVQGHAHHLALHTESYEYDGQSQQVQAWSLGCICRTDGGVPSTKSGSDEFGRPVLRHESWQHAVGVVTETEDGWWLEPIMIHDGKAMFRGKLIDVNNA
jgi:hypothetical protein